MVLSKRERYVAIFAVTGLLILGMDWLVVEPLLALKMQLDVQIENKRKELDHAQRVLETSEHLSTMWADMLRGMGKDESEAESQVVHNVHDWAQDAGMTLSSVKRERAAEKEKDFSKITIRAAGSGGMSQIGRFLWRIKTASVPVRITDLQISSHKEGLDDLAVSLGVSTIFLTADADKAGKPAPQAAEREETR